MTASNDSSLAGQFLVSMPQLKGDFFQSTVTLLIEHNDEGAFGLTVNKPLDILLSDVIDEMPASPVPVWQGGPVQADHIFFLHSTDKDYEGSFRLNDDVILSTSPQLLTEIAAGELPEEIIALAGYAGWAPGQLDDEILRDAWLVVPFDATIVYGRDFEEKPVRAARLLGIDLNLVGPTSGHG